MYMPAEQMKLHYATSITIIFNTNQVLPILTIHSSHLLMNWVHLIFIRLCLLDIHLYVCKEILYLNISCTEQMSAVLHFSDYLFLLAMTENTVMFCNLSDDNISKRTSG
jgi:hypothetical protein